MPDIINVTTAPPVNVSIQTVTTNLLTVETAGPSIAVIENGATPQNLFVGEEEPTMAAGGIWVETDSDGSFTLWIEDGT